MVWTPAPEIHTPVPVESPNILAIRMPEITKPFVAPQDAPKPVIAKVEIAANAPELLKHRPWIQSNCLRRQKL